MMRKKTKILLLTAASVIICSHPIQPGFSQTRFTRVNSTTNNYLENPVTNGNQERIIWMSGIGAIALAGLGLAVSFLSGKNRQQLETNLLAIGKLLLNRKRQQIKEFKLPIRDREDKPKNEDFQIVARDLIESYHTQALAQATSQYWFSVIAASFGFAVIMYAAIGALRSKEPQIALLNAIPGLAIEGVAVLFLTQADGTRKRATELYDRLRSDEKQLNAIALIDSIQDGTLRDVVKAQLALQFVGITSPSLNLSQHTQTPNYPSSTTTQPPDLPEMSDQTMINRDRPN